MDFPITQFMELLLEFDEPYVLVGREDKAIAKAVMCNDSNSGP